MKIKTAGLGENPVAHHLELQTGAPVESRFSSAMGYGPYTTWRPSTSKKEEHEKAATTGGRLKKRSLLTATGLIYPEKQL